MKETTHTIWAQIIVMTILKQVLLKQRWEDVELVQLCQKLAKFRNPRKVRNFSTT